MIIFQCFAKYPGRVNPKWGAKPYKISYPELLRLTVGLRFLEVLNFASSIAGTLKRGISPFFIGESFFLLNTIKIFQDIAFNFHGKPFFDHMYPL